MQYQFNLIEELVANGGPESADFPVLNEEFQILANRIKQAENSKILLSQFRKSLGNALSPETIQGYAFHKPYGYSGDFSVIDKIYNRYVSPNEQLKNWDLFFHSQKAPIAVRNRKDYFFQLLSRLRNRYPTEALQVLNIASGPCRDVREYLEKTNDKNIHFHCIDYDHHALGYAKQICQDHLAQITFLHKNALRYRSEQKFNLVWSAGLLDYFSDKQFIFLIQKLGALLDKNGELVVGNFHPGNPTRDYMELVGDWYLTYRTESELTHLAQEAGFCSNNIRVGAEEEQVNLFLHIKRGKYYM